MCIEVDEFVHALKRKARLSSLFLHPAAQPSPAKCSPKPPSWSQDGPLTDWDTLVVRLFVLLMV